MRFMLLLAAIVLPPVCAAAQTDDARVLDALRTGDVVVLLRHAATEAGTPTADCGTQPRLSAAGRDEARRIGESLRGLGARIDAVRAGAHCRTQETARLAFPAIEARTWPALDPASDRDERIRRTAEVRAALRDWPAGHGELWVTHRANVTALTGAYVMPGEAVVARVRGGRLEFLGRWRP